MGEVETHCVDWCSSGVLCPGFNTTGTAAIWDHQAQLFGHVAVNDATDTCCFCGVISTPPPLVPTLLAQAMHQLVLLHKLKNEVLLPCEDGTTISFWDLFK